MKNINLEEIGKGAESTQKLLTAIRKLTFLNDGESTSSILMQIREDYLLSNQDDDSETRKMKAQTLKAVSDFFKSF